MRRLKKHQGNLNRIIGDERNTGSRRTLAQALALWIDADDEKEVFPGLTERKIMSLVLLGTYGPNPRRVWWKEDDEEGVPEPDAKLSGETLQRLKETYGHLLGEM